MNLGSWVLGFGVFLALAGRSWAMDPHFAPPAVRLSPGLAEAPIIKRLETPGTVAVWREYSIGDPSSEEQMYLEYINRARALPWEEGFFWRQFLIRRSSLPTSFSEPISSEWSTKLHCTRRSRRWLWSLG